MEGEGGARKLPVAILDIFRAIDYPAELTPIHRTAAHQAGLNGYIQGGFLKDISRLKN